MDDLIAILALLGSAWAVLQHALTLRKEIDDNTEKIYFSSGIPFEKKVFILQKNIYERILVLVGLILFYGTVLCAVGFFVKLPGINLFIPQSIQVFGVMAWMGGILTAILGRKKYIKLKKHINKESDKSD